MERRRGDRGDVVARQRRRRRDRVSDRLATAMSWPNDMYSNSPLSESNRLIRFSTSSVISALDALERQLEREAAVERVRPRRAAGVARNDLADVLREAVVALDEGDEVADRCRRVIR